MRTINTNMILLSVGAMLVSLPAMAQSSTPGYSPDGVVLNKNVVEGSRPNTYTINLETYVTGDETRAVMAMDVVMVLDLSQSMSEMSAPVTSDYVLDDTKVYKLTDLTDGYTDLSLYKQTGRKTLNVEFLDGKNTISTSEGIITDYAYKNGSALCYVLVANVSGTRYILYHDMMTNTTTMLGKNTKAANLVTSSSVTFYKLKDGVSPDKKVDLMKRAASSFADILSNGAKLGNVNHRLGIVRFADNGYKNKATDISEDADYTPKAVVAKQLTSLNETGTTNLNAVKTAINQLTHAGQTYPSCGFNLASALFNQQGSSNNKKIIVFMTDGEPGSGDFNSGTANDAISAISPMKEAGTTVYSVGVFNSLKNKEGTYNFMNAVSSNHPHASSYSVNDNTAHDYFRVVGEKSLEEIFTDIATEVVSGGADYELEKKTTTVIDVVSPSFKLPDGANADSIKLYVAPCTGIQSIGTGTDEFTYVFGTAVPATQIEPDIKAEIGFLQKNESDGTVTFIKQVGGKAVSISNFGFSDDDHWVGKRSSAAGVSYGGYKLIISFPIEIDPRNQGGANVATNTEDSGIYTNDGTGLQKIGGFEIPHAKIPNLVVLKYGLHKGESATFNVINKDTDEIYPIVLVATQKSDDPNVPSVAKVKIQKPGRYEVVESTWAWAYNLKDSSGNDGRVSTYDVDDNVTGPNTSVDTWHELGYGDPGSGYQAAIPTVFGTVLPTGTRSIIRNVNDFTEDPNYNGTLFIFKNSLKSNMPAHAETNNNNVFYETN